MLFPILFNHMSFQTHHCWCVFVRRAIYLAADSWRRFYGQMQRHSEGTGTAVVQFQLPNGKQVDLPEGWSRRFNAPGEACYVDPNGILYTGEEMPEVACAMLTQWAESRTKKSLQQVLKKHGFLMVQHSASQTHEFRPL